VLSFRRTGRNARHSCRGCVWKQGPRSHDCALQLVANRVPRGALLKSASIHKPKNKARLLSKASTLAGGGGGGGGHSIKDLTRQALAPVLSCDEYWEFPSLGLTHHHQLRYLKTAPWPTIWNGEFWAPPNSGRLIGILGDSELWETHRNSGRPRILGDSSEFWATLNCGRLIGILGAPEFWATLSSGRLDEILVNASEFWATPYAVKNSGRRRRQNFVCCFVFLQIDPRPSFFWPPPPHLPPSHPRAPPAPGPRQSTVWET